MNGNCCSMRCQDDWFKKFGDLALDRFGRTTEPKRQDASGAWYKSYDYRGYRDEQDRHYFDLDKKGYRYATNWEIL